MLAIAADVVKSFAGLYRDAQMQKRIAWNEVEIGDLALTGNSAATYRLSGTVRNLSSKYTLTVVRFGFTVDDCVNGECRPQGSGHAEIPTDVRPTQTATFSTQIVSVQILAPLRGQRRFNSRVYLTVGQ